MRQMHALDRCTHRFLIEPISGQVHLKATLSSRFVKFAKNILQSKKFVVRFLANLLLSDQRTVFGRNIRKISKAISTEISDLTPSKVRQKMQYWTPNEEEMKIISFSEELLSVRNEDLFIEGFQKNEIEDIFHSLCIL